MGSERSGKRSRRRVPKARTPATREQAATARSPPAPWRRTAAKKRDGAPAAACGVSAHAPPRRPSA